MSTISVIHQTDEGVLSRVELEVSNEKAVELFTDLSRELFDRVSGVNKTKTSLETKDSATTYKATYSGIDLSSAPNKVAEVTSKITAKKAEDLQKTSAPVEKKQEETSPQKKAIKGFVDIVCPKCGKETLTSLKTPVDNFRCRECGEEFNISENCVPAVFKCKCGESFKYMTNHTEAMFDIKCINCGCPNTVEYSKHKHKYTGVSAN